VQILQTDRDNMLGNKKSLANAKGNARQPCMCEGLVQTKSKLRYRCFI